ncbi:Protein CBG03516 [Caenorhabditis briggsae]|uniref:Protein CBG03516 n=1 Tax=Caenorhabditis briggsae TaxID=6238 RepID=A8WV83_CAEBR|nr:Protein CBG03516 [Caenorhabditis briggsae]CAP24394.1 Protein CBG03516 [Caenorhabditis briggsae]
MKSLFCILIFIGCPSAVFGCAGYQFDQTAQEAIVKAHNDLRSDIAKGRNRTYRGALLKEASNMRKIKWDSTLEKSAQELADTCQEEKYRIAKYHRISTNPSESSIQQLAVNATTYWKEQFRFQSFNADYFKNAITKDSQITNNSSLYKQGTACSSCGSGFKCEEDSGLCVPV